MGDGKEHTFEYVEYFVDIIYIMDIIVAFRTSYVDSVGDEITKPSMIAKRYIGAGFFLDFFATLSVLPAIFPIAAYSYKGAQVLSSFGLFKILRVMRISEIIDKLNITAPSKASMKMIFVLYLLTLYHHVIACFLWFIFSIEKYWVPPKDFGYLVFDYMETATIEYSLLENYLVMLYHATFIFNGVDVAPVTGKEILMVLIAIIISAFANTILYGTFFVLQSKSNEFNQRFADDLNLCYLSNTELRLSK